MAQTVTKKEIIKVFKRLNDNGKNLMFNQSSILAQTKIYAIQPIDETILDDRCNEITERHKREKETLVTSTMKDKKGFILIGWHYLGGGNLKGVIKGYYLPETGARYVYSKLMKIVWKYNEDGRGYQAVVPDEYYCCKERKYKESGFCRYSRKEIAEQMKQDNARYVICAPLWLLTSIPDPRPRFLFPENEEWDQ